MTRRRSFYCVCVNAGAGAYAVMALPRERFLAPQPLPPGYSFRAPVDQAAAVGLLASEFTHLADDPSPLEPLWEGAIGLMLGEELVGIVFLSAARSTDRPGYARADYLVLDPSHRSSGLARALVAEFFRRAVERGYPGAITETNRPRVELFFRRLGADILGYERVPPARFRALRASLRPFRRLVRRFGVARARRASQRAVGGVTA